MSVMSKRESINLERRVGKDRVVYSKERESKEGGCNQSQLICYK